MKWLRVMLYESKKCVSTAGGVMSRSYHEELARGLARSFLRRCLRKSVGWQGGVKWEWRREKEERD